MSWLDIFLIVVCVVLVTMPTRYDPFIQLGRRTERRHLND